MSYKSGCGRANYPEAPDWSLLVCRPITQFSVKQEIDFEQAESSPVFCLFWRKLRYLTDEGLYGSYILAPPISITGRNRRSSSRIYMSGADDKLSFNYSGLDLLVRKRCLIRTRSHEPELNPYKKCIWVLPFILQCRKKGTTVCNG